LLPLVGFAGPEGVDGFAPAVLPGVALPDDEGAPGAPLGAIDRGGAFGVCFEETGRVGVDAILFVARLIGS